MSRIYCSIEKASCSIAYSEISHLCYILNKGYIYSQACLCRENEKKKRLLMAVPWDKEEGGTLTSHFEIFVLFDFIKNDFITFKISI